MNILDDTLNDKNISKDFRDALRERTKMLNEPEFSKIVDDAEKEVNEDVEVIFLNVISQLRETFNKLNNDDNYKLNLKLKAWFNKNVI